MIVNRINQWARTADKTAVIFNDVPITYSVFARAIEATRRHLDGLNLNPDGVVVVALSSLWEMWLFVMAARALGRTTVTVGRVEQAAGLNLGPVACILTSQAEEGLHHTEETSLAGVPVIVVPNSAYDAAHEGPLPAPAPASQRFGDHILYTSGTTGAFKKILVEGATEDRRIAARAEQNGFSRDTLFHVLEYGLSSGIGFKTPSAVWMRGGCVIIDQTAGRYANFLRYPITFAQTTPETLRAILAARDPAAPPAKGLTLRCGGGFVPLNLAQQAVAGLSPTFVFGFSSTEMATSLMHSPVKEADDLIWMVPRPERLVQVVDDEGVPCPPGVEGELRVMITEVDNTEYLDDPQATARFFRGGYFYPGDMAVTREDGRIRVLGRVADVINIKGRKHAVAPIEATLQQSLDVEEVCLFNGFTDEGVEEVVVAVQTKRFIPPEDFQRALGGSQIWDQVRVAVFKEFPRTETAMRKTNRVALRQMVFQKPA